MALFRRHQVVLDGVVQVFLHTGAQIVGVTEVGHRVGIAMSGRPAVPVQGFLPVSPPDTDAFIIQVTEIQFGRGISLFCGFQIPCYCLVVIPFYSPSCFITHRKVVLRPVVPVHGGPCVPFDGFFGIFFNAKPILVHNAERVLRFGILAVIRLHETGVCLFVLFCLIVTVAFFIGTGQCRTGESQKN